MVVSNVAVDWDLGEVMSEDELCVGINFNKLSCSYSSELLGCEGESGDSTKKVEVGEHGFWFIRNLLF
jgi:hypothetical protein